LTLAMTSRRSSSLRRQRVWTSTWRGALAVPSPGASRRSRHSPGNRFVRHLAAYPFGETHAIVGHDPVQHRGAEHVGRRQADDFCQTMVDIGDALVLDDGDAAQTALDHRPVTRLGLFQRPAGRLGFAHFERQRLVRGRQIARTLGNDLFLTPVEVF